MYGDSLWDVGQQLDTCDLCGLFDGDFTIRNFASAGAEIWHQTPCDGSPRPDPDCRNGADRALACWATVESMPTCLEANHDASVLLLQFGTNDVRNAVRDDVRWSHTDKPRYVASLRSILAAKPLHMACVLAVPPPIWSPGYEIFNPRLSELRTIIRDEAAVAGCTVADLYSAYLALEASQGPGASLDLYFDCPSIGGPGDCVHYAVRRPSLPAEVLQNAIEEAIRVPEPDGPSGGTAAAATVLALGALARRLRLRSHGPANRGSQARARSTPSPAGSRSRYTGRLRSRRPSVG